VVKQKSKSERFRDLELKYGLMSFDERLAAHELLIDKMAKVISSHTSDDKGKQSKK
jgi:hypothetical protein